MGGKARSENFVFTPRLFSNENNNHGFTVVQNNHSITEAACTCPEIHCSYYSTIGKRPEDEDAALASKLSVQDLTNNEGAILSPEEIGYILYTLYLDMHDIFVRAYPSDPSGTTACTTVYNGDGAFITANIGDSLSFAVVYDVNHQVVSVTQLNRVIHDPGDVREKARIQNAGGYLFDDFGVARVNGILSVARGIGDNREGLRRIPAFRGTPFSPICSDARIDIIKIDQLMGYKEGCKVKIITACDGLSEFIVSHSPDIHESFLKKALQDTDFTNNSETAKSLANMAIGQGSGDNVSVIVQDIDKQMPVINGVYDGHAGSTASTYVVENLLTEFKILCSLSKQYYENKSNSVSNRLLAYALSNEYYSSLSDIKKVYFLTAKIHEIKNHPHRLVLIKALNNLPAELVIEDTFNHLKVETSIQSLSTLSKVHPDLLTKKNALRLFQSEDLTLKDVQLNEQFKSADINIKITLKNLELAGCLNSSNAITVDQSNNSQFLVMLNFLYERMLLNHKLFDQLNPADPIFVEKIIPLMDAVNLLLDRGCLNIGNVTKFLSCTVNELKFFLEIMSTSLGPQNLSNFLKRDLNEQLELIGSCVFEGFLHLDCNNLEDDNLYNILLLMKKVNLLNKDNFVKICGIGFMDTLDQLLELDQNLNQSEFDLLINEDRLEVQEMENQNKKIESEFIAQTIETISSLESTDDLTEFENKFKHSPEYARWSSSFTDSACFILAQIEEKLDEKKQELNSSRYHL